MDKKKKLFTPFVVSLSNHIERVIIATSFIICILCTPARAQEHELYGVSFYSPRSQSTNLARKLVGQHPYMHHTEGSECYGVFSVTPEYMRAYKTRRIAEHFFGTDTIRFSGSQVTTRADDDILADYFGLSPQFDSTVRIDPKLTSFLIDFNLYGGLDCLWEGLYVQAHLPVVWTESYLCLQETVRNNGTSTEFPANYMAVDAIGAPAQSAKRGFEGDLVFGQMTEPIKYGKISGCVEESKASDLQVALGWNFVRRERGHAGISLRMAAPTGTRPTGEYMFEPVNGNGRHWEFGLGVNGQALLWEKDGEQNVAITVEATFMHMFKARQCRSFDFTDNGFGSRFILLKEFDDAGTYAVKLLPAINVTTLPCNVWNSMQIEGIFMLSYHNRHWTFDLGYNGWIRTREKICLLGAIPENKYGFKGIQNVSPLANENRTQSDATLHGNMLDAATQDEVVDNPSPVFIKTADLDLCSAAMPRSISHKFFTHVSYAWDFRDNQRTIPYLGFGFELEFEGLKLNQSEPNKNTMSMFGFWTKFGLAF